MDIIVRGNPQELDFVRRFCRDKVRRGMLAILPATSPDRDEVVRLKNERDEAFAKLKENEARISDLEEQLSSLIASKDVEDENGIDLSVETVAVEMSEASEDDPSEDKGAFITGADFLIDGGATAAYFYGELKPGN